MDTHIKHPASPPPSPLGSGTCHTETTVNAPTVAIVDDDKDTCSALSWLLNSVDLNSRIYYRAQDFLDEPNKHEISCILLDVRMPGMSGPELYENLKQQRLDIPVVFLSGHADIPLAVHALKSGAVDFITKPFNAQKLIDSIHSAINTHKERTAEKIKCLEIEDRLNTLTARELEVLEGIVAGKRSKEIALDLGISNKTVELYRAKIMDKIRAKSSLELIRMIFSYQLNASKKQYHFI